MTDAALPVTERAVERFTEAYLRSLGAEIEKRGRQWTVTLPADADTALELDGDVLEIVSDSDEVDEGVIAISPEAPFVERMLDESADRTPIGSLSLTQDQFELKLPPWITGGTVEVVDGSFTPYYDRRALCALFHVGIETVSEYQTEELHAVAVDLNDHEERPRLAETYLDLAEDDQRDPSEGRQFDEQTLGDAIETANEVLESEIAPMVRDTRERATRAAEVELDEYRQFVQQRREEIDEELSRLNDRIEDETEAIDAATEQAERVEALRKRKELQSELDDRRAELDDLTEQIERNFPEKRREVRERHDLTVRMRPVSATSVSYERGDLILELTTGDATVEKSYSYAIGVGVMEEPSCDRCGRQLTWENPLALERSHFIGDACCGD
ncbi:hypothetical protein OB920_05115 [Halobacteria archaeon HArc-gm2]|nr:hypothetical protein [Halobacteria archaeon HArc-gm2]